MEARISQLRSAVRLPARVRAVAMDRVNLALGAVFLLGAVLYLWTAATSYTLELNGSQTDPYNLLATTFLHLHLSVGRPPVGLLRLPEPYNPVANSTFQLHPRDIHDFALYHGKLYLTWGPTPVLVLFIPLHLLGLEPSTSLAAAIFAIVGLGFALAVLRVVLRQLGRAPLWMCVLAALALALSSVMPFTLRRPEVYEGAIAAGFCFAMAGIWLAVSALLERRASLRRLALASLCFGLAVGARPPLAAAALVLVPVYLAFRATLPGRGLLIALLGPIGVCGLLLALYNQVRFGSPLEVGTKYALAGFNQHTAHFGAAGYVVPGAWYYLLSPPRPTILFPFLQLAPPPESYPGTLPANYQAFELTAGLLPMAPILVFLAALPWVWRRRPKLLGSLGAPLLILAGAGVFGLLFLSYEFYATTERYEVDFATLFLFGALAAWLALSVNLRGWARRLVRIGGALLAVWGCFAGLAIGFTGYANLLQADYPSTWSTLEHISSPLSRAIATVDGGPVLAEVYASKVIQASPVTYTTLTASTTAFALGVGERVEFVVVSPDTRTAALVANMTPAVAVAGGAKPSTSALMLIVRGPGRTSHTFTIQPGGAVRRIPLYLNPGVDHLALRAVAPPAGRGKPAIPASKQALVLTNLSLSGHE